MIFVISFYFIANLKLSEEQILKILPKGYKLINTIQHYDWGTKGDNAVIPKILGIEAEPGLPYAELWIGAHPKSPSKVKIESENIPLDKLIETMPLEILGKRISEKFDNKLPFLFKVLSSGKALSIQAHPDKKLAKLLHKKDPKNYPDENHKPEIAIAIDKLFAIAGFKPATEMIKILRKFPLLQKTVGAKEIGSLDLKNFYSAIMRMNHQELKNLIDEILLIIQSDSVPSKEESEFIEQFSNYGYDVGLISILLYNYVILNPGEAFSTAAGVPHAYLRGNIIECMANSDNVVRAGLTTKFKDVNTLLKMLDYSSATVEVEKRDTAKREHLYRSNADEFSILNIRGNYSKRIEGNEDVMIGFVLDGEVELIPNKNSSCSEIYRRGEAFLIPAVLSNFDLKSTDNTNYFLIFVP